ncbi:retinol dehydrogenase 11-like [Salvia hispanica]|uniref:retinol dehydrogenase 11-like n=1 Tax=Salvia hispanica TaxID=49212 RepID=UPI002009BF6F|nr:retinol dehydrogenase 11-like [Salvia hispanica]
MQARIEGKNCVVTGANSGIGYATAEGLAARGATVYIVCRSKEWGEAAHSKIQSATGNKNVHLEICDISSIDDVKTLASRFCAMDEPVHILRLSSNLRTSDEGADTVIWLALQPKEKLVLLRPG